MCVGVYAYMSQKNINFTAYKSTCIQACTQKNKSILSLKERLFNLLVPLSM